MRTPKVILITGASRGIGLAIAEAFAASGTSHHFILTARHADRLEDAAALLKKINPACTVLTRAADLSVTAETQSLGQWVMEQFPAVDIIVNNAGHFLPGGVHTEAEGTLESLLGANLYSAYHLTRSLLPGMIARRSGHIFNICSIASLQAYANGGSYSISKFAMLGMGKNLREELKPFGIKVTNVLPGATYTDSWAASGLPRERFMEAADVAAMIYATAHLSAQACVEEIVMRPQEGDI
jgi:short-subunit dehydrogenase